MIYKDTYKKIPLFENISPENIKSLLSCLISFERAYKKDEIIILDHENIDYVGVVISGNVLMRKEDVFGNQTLLSYVSPFELFGEIFAVQHETKSYVSFVAASDTTVLFLAARNIISNCPNHCTFHSELTRNMFHLLGQKSTRLMEKIEVSSKSPLREKILSYLSMEVQKQNTSYITISLDRNTMADYLGANRSALSRELSAMKKEGIIDYYRNTFVIKELSDND